MVGLADPAYGCFKDLVTVTALDIATSLPTQTTGAAAQPPSSPGKTANSYYSKFNVEYALVPNQLIRSVTCKFLNLLYSTKFSPISQHPKLFISQ